MRWVIIISLILPIMVGAQEMTNGLLQGGIAVNGGVIVNNGDVYVKPSGAWVFLTRENETNIILSTINLSAGGEIRIDWGDGNINTYTGSNSNITKNYTSGQYTIKMYCNDWSKITHMVLSADIIDDLTNVRFSNMINVSTLIISDNNFTGTTPIKQKNTRIYSLQGNDFTNYDTALYDNNTYAVLFNNNNISDSLLIGEIYEDIDAGITVPANNMVIDTRGPNMGTLPGGELNTHLVSLKSKYATAGKTLTYYYNAP